MPGSIPGWGSYLRQVFFTLITYVDPTLIGYLNVRQLMSRILGTWRRCGVMDKVSYIQGPHVSTAHRPICSEAMYLVSLEGNGHLVYKHPWSTGCCATWCIMPAPSSCRSWVPFNPCLWGDDQLNPAWNLTVLTHWVRVGHFWFRKWLYLPLSPVSHPSKAGLEEDIAIFWTINDPPGLQG